MFLFVGLFLQFGLAGAHHDDLLQSASAAYQEALAHSREMAAYVDQGDEDAAAISREQANASLDRSASFLSQARARGLTPSETLVVDNRLAQLLEAYEAVYDGSVIEILITEGIDPVPDGDGDGDADGDGGPGVIDSAPYLAEIFLNILLLILRFAAYVALVMIVFSGIWYMISSGDLARIERAKKTLIGSVIGLSIVLFALAGVYILSGLFV